MQTKINVLNEIQILHPTTDMHSEIDRDETNLLLDEIYELEAMERQDALPLDEFLYEAPEFDPKNFLATLNNY